MKRIILILALLIMIGSANAIFGGESATIYEEDCTISYVNITGNQTIETGEFTLSDNCIFESKWVYNCTCDEPIVLATKVNTVNTYFISTDIWKEKEEPTEETTTGGSTHRGSHTYSHQDEIIKAEKPKDKEEPDGGGYIEEEQEEIVVEEERDYSWLVVTLLIIIVVSVIGYFIFKKD